MKQYKAALVGYGGMGHWHFEGICKTDRVKFVGVYDIDPKRMELAKSEGFEKLYDSYEAMLADAEAWTSSWWPPPTTSIKPWYARRWRPGKPSCARSRWPCPAESCRT